jgi:membrane associated rhomboid family serine protease
MLLLLPIRTSIWPRRTPYANYALIAVNVAIFFLSYSLQRRYTYIIGNYVGALPIRPSFFAWMLVPSRWQYWQFLSYAFLHGGILHLVGNMFFLYLFGNNINDKLGNFRYALFYLTGAIFSGMGYTLLHLYSPIPTLGASGAVSAVIGAYFVLFPQTQITVLYWVIFLIGTVQVPALYFIGFKLIILDNIITQFTPGVAYDAHLAGYAYGITLILFLLKTRLLSGTRYDLWGMIQQWNRRRQYRDMVGAGYDPFRGVSMRRPVASKEIPKVHVRRPENIEQIRHAIADRIGQHNLHAAADLYVELMRLDPEQVLPRQHLLDIANQLASEHRAVEAAQAYEQFLSHYRTTYEYSEQVELMLGILYSRYLHQREKAVEHLQRAAERLIDPAQARMCRDELARLGV